MTNREHLEEVTGIKSKLSDHDLAEDIAKKWKGKCGWSMCPAYNGFNEADNTDLCNINEGEESLEACTSAIYKWLIGLYQMRS